MKNSEIVLAMAEAMRLQGGMGAPIVRYDRPYKGCLNCGIPHQHNNSWCSKECCKEYKSNASI